MELFVVEQIVNGRVALLSYYMPPLITVIDTKEQCTNKEVIYRTSGLEY